MRAAHERETGSPGLDERALAILAFEREAWKLAIPKHRAIRERLEISPTRYHQLLNRIIETPEALAVDPMLVRRLRRIQRSATPPARGRASGRAPLTRRGEPSNA